MFKKIRILILLLILATVGLETWRSSSRLTSWEHTAHIAVFPIAADDSPATARFISGVNSEYFSDIEQWVQDQSGRYGATVIRPVAVRAGPPVTEKPPLPPERASALEAVIWSLKLRWWASRHDDIAGPKPRVRLFVLFHDPERRAALPHSTGLDKGKIGIIHAFASREQRSQNAVVIAHELLHTFGATDKYDPATLQPVFPQGYAEPDLDPRLPQRLAEIMGGRTPIGEGRARIPDSLADTLIGPETAREIGLLKASTQ